MVEKTVMEKIEQTSYILEVSGQGRERNFRKKYKLVAVYQNSTA